MKRFFTVLTAGLLILAIAAPAMAWEFSMNGEYVFRLQYLNRTGNDDLFGQGGNVGFAGPNIYNGGANGSAAHLNGVNAPASIAGGAASAGANNAGTGGPNTGFDPGVAVAGFPAAAGQAQLIARGGYSVWGDSALVNDQRLTLVPTIRVNNAIRVHGVYNIGGYRNQFNQNAAGVGIPPFERYYQLRVSNYTYGTASMGSWEQVRLTVQLPICILSIGIKDFPFGTGAALAHHSASDAWFMIVPWGPFRIFAAQWLARNAPGLGEGYNTRPDGAIKRIFMGTPAGLGGTYDNGPLEIFWLAFWMWNHADIAPGAAAFSQPGAAVIGPNYGFGQGYDWYTENFGLGFKYNNGRFFANFEYGWNNTNVTKPIAIQSAPGGVAQLAAPAGQVASQRFQESSYVFAESGFLCGPAKLAFMWAYSPGQQLVAPGAGATQPLPGWFFPNPTKWRALAPINYQVMEAYNYLMFYTYGGGNNEWNSATANGDGHGHFSDANAYAARFDYAVASNLNVWASYMWAERLEKDGYYFGSFNPGTARANELAPLTQAQVFNLIGYAPGGGVSPFAGNGFLGWEMNFGVDWKLLEGMSTFVRYAYWQPGDWFDRAYQYGTRTDGAVGAFPNYWFFKQGRSAIQALYWSVVVNF